MMIRRFLFTAMLVAMVWQVQLAQAQSPLDKFKQKMDELKPSGKYLRQILGQDEEPEAKITEAKSIADARTPTPAQRPHPVQRPNPAPTYRGQPPLANYQPSLQAPPKDRAQSANELGLITEESKQGLKVALVQAGSAADRAGIKVNDRIIKFAGIGVESEEELNGIAGALRAGDQIEITISRDGKPQDVVVTVGEAVNQDENAADVQAATSPINPTDSSPANDFQPSAEAVQRELATLRKTVEEQQQIITELQQRLRAVQASQFRGR